MKFLRLILLSAASVGLLAGCGDSDNNNSEEGGTAFSLFTPATESQVPFPINLFFADPTNTSGPVAGLSPDATLNIPNSNNAPFVDNANLQDGFSTTANIFTDFIGADIDPATIAAGGIIVINTATGAPLQQGVDYQVMPSAVVAGRPRLLIQPLTPLQPATSYVVILTSTLRTSSGGPIVPGEQFLITANPAPVGSEENPASDFTPAQRQTLAAVQANLVRPIFNAVIDPNPNLDAEDVVLTWSFTTQSISDSLDFVNSQAPNVPAQIGVVDTGFSSGDLGSPFDTADLFSGTVDLAYFLNAAQAPTDPTPLVTFWQSNGVNAGGNSALLGPAGPIPCAAFSQSTSTTRCYPQPQLQSTQSVPVLIAVPNANTPSGGNPPAGGWPVVIFQHGITRNRADMIAIAPTLALAGFVTVAIDLPLHGIPVHDPASGLRITGSERNFSIDLGATTVSAQGECDQDLGALGGNIAPDGTEDCSGAYFNNLGSLITGRDNLRQGAADLIQLSSTLRVDNGEASGANDIPLLTGGSIDIADDNVQYVGHSLGGIVGGTFLGVHNGVNAASLAMPGGGIGKLLDGSAGFGPVVAGALAGLGIVEGTDTYETYLRFAQTLIDAGDPINYAADAGANHPIHMIEIIGGSNGTNPPDLVVPNFVVRNVPPGAPCPVSASFSPAFDLVCVSGALSGTDPLAAEQGLSSLIISPPYASPSPQPSADTVIRFTAGHHGSILDPSTGSTPPGSVDPGEAFRTTCEIQSQIAGFLGRAAAGVPEANLIIPVGVTDCTPPMMP